MLSLGFIHIQPPARNWTLFTVKTREGFPIVGGHRHNFPLAFFFHTDSLSQNNKKCDNHVSHPYFHYAVKICCIVKRKVKSFGLNNNSTENRSKLIFWFKQIAKINLQTLQALFLHFLISASEAKAKTQKGKLCVGVCVQSWCHPNVQILVRTLFP